MTNGAVEAIALAPDGAACVGGSFTEVAIGLRQPISVREGLGSGRYSETLTFTLAATAP